MELRPIRTQTDYQEALRLSRKRSLSLEMIRKLNQELGIPADILIQPYESAQISA